ncbi:M1 family metallopeptidase [Pseudohalioglobus lutimaris]|uniref:Aminopeptidase N n=1 Tax=Pseudohalioglobus lutimaris TaxID=1737061 RepID=A0A2N5X111_9GAMM|nr:M1 family aminopeptidase [Pseudohalioglobus lutimaris]PLW68166.1 peptidase M1 [Pseudohalioglobus lutimaris]
MIRVCLFFLGLLAPSLAVAADLPVESGVSLELAQHRAQNISRVNYRLHFDIPAEIEAPIRAESLISFTLASNEQPLQLDFREDSALLVSVSCNGKPVKVDHRNEHLVIPAAALKAGKNTVGVVFTAGDSSLNRNPDYLHTLFVPDRARTAFPLFDQPDLKATFDLTLDLPTNWSAQANAPLAYRETVNDKQRHVFGTSDAISSYLFAFVAGEFEEVTREINGRKMSLLHRETDAEKVARNIDTIFQQHASGIDWMERYSGIDYPFAKFDFALIPGFPYGGMEHVGAIFYRAEKLFLDENPTERQLLDRATLIAHETAHMWFGNLVTMAWFNDVWTKEVFANFMAAKMVNPEFPAIDHQLSFLVDHYPAAYAVDRTAGANPIRQSLPNLADAGQMYGSIIYHKAPIMMRQLELILGEQTFREGMQEYLNHYANGNVTWPELIDILDEKTKTDLKAWSAVWVNSPGRPAFQLAVNNKGVLELRQHDPAGEARVWPQQFAVMPGLGAGVRPVKLNSTEAVIPWPIAARPQDTAFLFNADAVGYGLFPATLETIREWEGLTDLQKGALLVDLNENLLAQNGLDAVEYLTALLGVLAVEGNALVLGLALDQASAIYPVMLTPGHQQAVQAQLENVLWQRLEEETDSGRARQFFEAFTAMASSPEQLKRIHSIWSGEETLTQVTLSETDSIRLARILAVRLPAQADKIVATELARIKNPDNRRRLAFIAPALSADQSERDAFFTSLADEQNRRTESWVLDALASLHHPSRTGQSVKYLPRTLELLQEVQRTGEIFFPTGWLQTSFQNHNSAEASSTAQQFLDARPHYSEQLRMKILQAADKPERAYRISRGLK